jgi:hypothetical protein
VRRPADGPHPDVDTLSDLDGGVLESTPDEARLRAHVADCAPCADLIGHLRGTRSLLAGLPGVPLPADVAARLDTALAEVAVTPVAGSGGATVLTTRGKRHRLGGAPRRWLPGAGVAAAGVALLLAGAVGLSTFRDHGGNRRVASRATAGGAAGAVAPLRTPVTSGRDYTPATLTAGVVSLLPPRPTRTPSSPPPTPTPPPVALAPNRSAETGTQAALASLHQPAALRACVTELAGTDRITPLAVDFARFQGKPAVVVVLPSKNPAKVQVWVVGPNCRKGQSDLLFYTEPRVA